MAFRRENGTGSPRDRQKKGAAALTEDEVRVIKRELEDGEDVKELSLRYMVGVETIRRIRRGDSWWWVRAEGKEIPITEEIKKKAAESLERLRAMGLVTEDSPPKLDMYSEIAKTLKREGESQDTSAAQRLIDEVNGRKKLLEGLDDLKSEPGGSKDG